MSDLSTSSDSRRSLGIRLLIAEAKTGSDTAREELFTRCRNYMAVVARSQVESYLRAKVDSSDLIQQSMLEAHRGFDNFKGESEGEWLAWLKQIICHNAADYVRKYAMTAKRQVGREVPLASPGDAGRSARAMQLSDHAETPSQVMMRHERALGITEAITRLQEDHQEVIRLRNLLRLPFNEVAERMGRSRGAVQMLWMRAVEGLRKEYGRLMDDSSC